MHSSKTFSFKLTAASCGPTFFCGNSKAILSEYRISSVLPHFLRVMKLNEQEAPAASHNNVNTRAKTCAKSSLEYTQPPLRR